MASITRRPDGRWRARYRDANGREHAKHFQRKTDGEAWLVVQQSAIQRGEWVDPKAGRVVFAEFVDRWLTAQTFDESTREAVASRLRVHILPTFGSMALRSIRPSDVQAWIRGRQLAVAPSFARVLLANLSSVLGAAVADGLIVRNPCAASSVRAPRVVETRVVPWSGERVLAVAAVMPQRYRPLVILAAGCGLRQGECFGLRVEDVEFLARRVAVRQQVKQVGGKLLLAPPKGGRVRDVPLPEVVAVELAEHLRRYPARADGLVFTSREGKPLNRNYINARVWKPALRQAGVEPTRVNGMHALRHHYASVLLDAGQSIKAVSEYLGHADPGFTLRVYTHLLPASEDRARQAVDAALAPLGSTAAAVQ